MLWSNVMSLPLVSPNAAASSSPNASERVALHVEELQADAEACGVRLVLAVRGGGRLRVGRGRGTAAGWVDVVSSLPSPQTLPPLPYDVVLFGFFQPGERR